MAKNETKLVDLILGTNVLKELFVQDGLELTIDEKTRKIVITGDEFGKAKYILDPDDIVNIAFNEQIIVHGSYVIPSGAEVNIEPGGALVIL